MSHSQLASSSPRDVATGLIESDQLRRKLQRLLRWSTVLIVLMVLAPVAVIFFSWGSDQTEIWQHLIATQLSTLLRNTVVLVLGVGISVTVIGVTLAWLTVMCEFPGRRWFDWALMLPMAMPAYVLAFVVLGIFDFSGPIQMGLKQWLGDGYNYVDIRGEFTVIAVLTLVLYPYVYMLARSAFLSQSSDVIEAARVLGASSWGAFFRVVLPMARPAIVAGTSLAVMETLADFGTVSVFNYDTFTTAIYKSWFGFFNLPAAAQLASLLLLFVALALMAEKRSRGTRRYVQGSRLQHRYRYQLSGWKKWLSALGCSLVLLIAFVAPLLQLLAWVLEEGLAMLGSSYLDLLWHTLLLGAMAALITVSLALLLAFSRRDASNRFKAFCGLATLGYALPGSVLAVGVVLSFAEIDRYVLMPLQGLLGLEPRQLLVGSLLTLLAAYWVRFLAVANGPVEAGLMRIRRSIPEAARSLGAGRTKVFWQIYLPMLRPGLLTGAVLVFVDVMKEMPATLLLRPYGWDTLAVRIYELTSEGEWERAALPAVTLVLVGLLPVAQAIRQSRR
jgi:iron(III) transport system permease protein